VAKNLLHFQLVNVADLIIGLSMAGTGLMILANLRKQKPIAPAWKRGLAIFVMVAGFTLAMWEPMFHLAQKGHL